MKHNAAVKKQSLKAEARPLLSRTDPASPVIRVEFEKIPEPLAMRLGAAVYTATFKWLEGQQKGKLDEQETL